MPSPAPPHPKVVWPGGLPAARLAAGSAGWRQRQRLRLPVLRRCCCRLWALRSAGKLHEIPLPLRPPLPLPLEGRGRGSAGQRLTELGELSCELLCRCGGFALPASGFQHLAGELDMPPRGINAN